MSGRIFLGWTSTKQWIVFCSRTQHCDSAQRWGSNQHTFHPQSKALPIEPSHIAYVITCWTIVLVFVFVSLLLFLHTIILTLCVKIMSAEDDIFSLKLALQIFNDQSAHAAICLRHVADESWWATHSSQSDTVGNQSATSRKPLKPVFNQNQSLLVFCACWKDCLRLVLFEDLFATFIKSYNDFYHLAGILNFLSLD